MAKPNISTILKAGAKLEPKQHLTKEDLRLIEYTISEQQKLIDQQKKPITNLRVTI